MIHHTTSSLITRQAPLSKQYSFTGVDDVITHMDHGGQLHDAIWHGDEGNGLTGRESFREEARGAGRKAQRSFRGETRGRAKRV